jgi:hypothetical protein
MEGIQVNNSDDPTSQRLPSTDFGKEGSENSDNALESDYENDYLDDVVEEEGYMLVPACFVLFGRIYSEYMQAIIDQKGLDILNDPALQGCAFVVDKDKPVRNNPDLWRICVVFESADDYAHFQSRKTVEVSVDGGMRKLSFNISQLDLSWAVKDGKIRLLSRMCLPNRTSFLD